MNRQKILACAAAESLGYLDPPLPKKKNIQNVKTVDSEAKIVENNINSAANDEEVTMANNVENDTWSTDKCVFCSELLNGEFKILKCLHIICKNCLLTKKTDQGVECKCSIITKNDLTDYPIKPPSTLNIKICSANNCDEEANRTCIRCKILFCKPCSKAHLYSEEDHDLDLIHPYPMENENIFCSCVEVSCKKKIVEVYCIKCSVMICSLCHLNSHIKHKYKILENYGRETMSVLSNEKLTLEKNNKFLNFCVEQTEEQTQDLEEKRKCLHKDIDKETEYLHNAIDKRAIELKNAVNDIVSETVSTANTNKTKCKDILQKNTYCLSLTESILNHDKIHDVINLSKFILPKIRNTENHELILMNNVLINKTNIGFEYKETLKNCSAAIKQFGNITSTKVLDSSEFNNTQPSNTVIQFIGNQTNNSVDHILIKNESLSSKSYESDDSSDYEPSVACSCCNQSLDQLVKCICCNRLYHNMCHIPSMTIEELQANWTCTMCVDIGKYSKNVGEQIIAEDISPRTPGRKILERILLELFCQNDDSEHFRDCPSIDLYPLYHEKVTSPISLNDIKNCLESNSYSNIIDVVNDLKRVFSNAMSYYSSSDPFYESALHLETLLSIMISKWLPSLRYE